MKKYYLPILGIFIVFVFGIYMYVSHINSGKKIHQLYSFNNSDIKKIIFYDGRGGLNKPLIIKNQAKINQFMGYIDKYVIGAKTTVMKTGWIHKCAFYDYKNNKVLDITFGNPITINNNSYKVLQNHLNTNEIDNFLKSVSPSWKIKR